MERKHATPEEERRGDWVQTGLRVILQLLASPAYNQIHHYPPGVNLMGELLGDYFHFSESVTTYWFLSPEQTRRLTALQDFILAHDIPQYSDLWEEEALFSHPLWDEIRALAKAALISFEWPIEPPPPEPGHA